ncbi:MAG: Uma2 family endonuclease [Planctomycetaceae bacterium]|nr:Uma2 family endonuclease [Planctomycetaceae bacterium]
MSTRTCTITTAEQLLNAPSDLGRCELVRGELVMMSPAKGRHGVVVVNIVHALHSFLKASRLGQVFDSSTGFLLSRDPDTVRSPDISFLNAERLKGQDLDAFLEGAPDLAVEVLSPSNTAAEMRDKMNEYFNAGCRVVWIVDPQHRSVVVHRPNAGPAILAEGDTLTEEELLPGFSLVVKEIFPPA